VTPLQTLEDDPGRPSQADIDSLARLDGDFVHSRFAPAASDHVNCYPAPSAKI